MKHQLALSSVAFLVLHAACSSAPSKSDAPSKSAAPAAPAASSSASAGPSAPNGAAQTAGPSGPAKTAKIDASAKTEASAKQEAPPMTTKVESLYDFETKTLEGAPAKLDALRGQVVLVVNVASECGYTPQYAGLEKLHQELASKGFTVVGFPCNDFGGQEPGDATAIRTFCTDKYAVTFPLYAKVKTKAGSDQSPVYAWLGKSTGSLPSWNFCKYLVGKDGKPIAFWPSKVAPDSPELRKAIDTALAAK